jgi:hypothetical protein
LDLDVFEQPVSKVFSCNREETELTLSKAFLPFVSPLPLAARIIPATWYEGIAEGLGVRKPRRPRLTNKYEPKQRSWLMPLPKVHEMLIHWRILNQ